MRCVILGGKREGWVDGGREGERMYGWMDVVERKASRKEYVKNTSHQKDKVLCTYMQKSKSVQVY